MGYEYKGRKLPTKKEYAKNGYYEMDWPQELINLVDGLEVHCEFYFTGSKASIVSPATARVVGDHIEFDVKEKIAHDDISTYSGREIRKTKVLAENPTMKLSRFLLRLNSAKDNRLEYVFGERPGYHEIFYETDNETVKCVQKQTQDWFSDRYDWQFVKPGIEEKIIEAYDKAFEKGFYKATNNKSAYYKTTLKEIGLDINKMTCPDWF